MLAEPRERTAPKIATTIRDLNGLRDVVHRDPEIIYGVVCQYFDVDKTDLMSLRRNVAYVNARFWAMYLMKTQWGMSYPYIGRIFGDRDHTTIIHGVKKVVADIATSEDARRTEVDLVVALRRAETGAVMLAEALAKQSSAINKTICAYFDVSEDELLSKSKLQGVLEARQWAMYLMRNRSTLSLDAISREYGGLSQTAAQTAFGKISDLLRSPGIEGDKARRVHAELVAALAKAGVR
jgi:chromosomal replication initiation ATPase DnaA